MQILYMLSAVDLRRAEDPESARPVIISKLTIPAIKFITASHNPGGGVMAVDFALPRIEALEPAMSCAGIDTEIFGGMGVRERWTFAAAYRPKTGGAKPVPGRGIVEGAVVEWEPDESDPEAFQGCTHKWAEVTHFEFHLADEELIYFDFEERVVRRKGVDLFADDRAALGA